MAAFRATRTPDELAEVYFVPRVGCTIKLPLQFVVIFLKLLFVSLTGQH